MGIVARLRKVLVSFPNDAEEKAFKTEPPPSGGFGDVRLYTVVPPVEEPRACAEPGCSVGSEWFDTLAGMVHHDFYATHRFSPAKEVG